ncbi:MAG: hypothetical protein ACYCXG_06655 [Acidiferrobacter sp.]
MVMTATPATVVQHLAHAQPPPGSLLARLLRLMPPPARTSLRRGPVPTAAASPSIGFSVYSATHSAPHVWGLSPVRFGIRAGTWVRVRLRRPITAGGTAIIVLHVMAPVAGTSRVLAVGSQLLARAAVAVDGRLRLTVSALVTTGGREFPIIGVVFDRHHDMGLPGFISHRGLGRPWFALGHSLVASADRALGMAALGDTLPAATLSSAGRSVLGATFHWRRPRVVLYVPPQRAFVQIQKAF